MRRLGVSRLWADNYDILRDRDDERPKMTSDVALRARSDRFLLDFAKRVVKFITP